MVHRGRLLIAPIIPSIAYRSRTFATTVQAHTLPALSEAAIVTTGSPYTALAPNRLLDTRTSRTPLDANGTLNLIVPGGSVPQRDCGGVERHRDQRHGGRPLPPLRLSARNCHFLPCRGWPQACVGNRHLYNPYSSRADWWLDLELTQ